MSKYVLSLLLVTPLLCHAGIPHVEPGLKLLSSPSEEMIKVKRSITTNKDYIEVNNNNSNNLLTIKDRAINDNFNIKSDPYNYYLRKNINDIELSFVYIPFSNQQELLGFAPAGTKIKSGWTGINEYLENNEIGICNISSYHMQNSQMQVQMIQSSVSYTIKNNPTRNGIIKDKSGFIYKIFWVDNTFSHDFECASKELNKSIMDKMIIFANNRG
jgi:hypothetical protein